MHTPSPRQTVRRHPERGRYDRATIEAILGEAFVCHLGFLEGAQPYVIPTMFARDGDRVIVHGSTASRMIRTLEEGGPVCLTVTVLDGIVLARSANNHSMNYRSVVVLGEATPIDEPEEKLHAMRALVERIAPGRWAKVRPPNDRELKATRILAIPLDESTAKVRTGPPVDEPDDIGLPVWGGVVPVGLRAGAPFADGHVSNGISPGDDVETLVRRLGEG